MITRIGSDNLLMAYSHVAHDCVLGDRIVLANGVQLGGHVQVEDYAVIGALAGIHQFVRVGESAIVGAGSMVSQDVPPFCNATGDRARLIGLNSVGSRRRGLEAALPALKRAFACSSARAAQRLGDRAAAGRTPRRPEVERLLFSSSAPSAVSSCSRLAGWPRGVGARGAGAVMVARGLIAATDGFRPLARRGAGDLSRRRRARGETEPDLAITSLLTWIPSGARGDASRSEPDVAAR